jgi:hypothetical protein
MLLAGQAQHFPAEAMLQVQLAQAAAVAVSWLLQRLQLSKHGMASPAVCNIHTYR